MITSPALYQQAILAPMHTSLTQQSQSGLTMPLPRHSEGTYPEMSAHTTRQGTLSSLSHCGPILALRVELVISVHKLVSTLEKKEEKKQEMNGHHRVWLTICDQQMCD